MCKTGGYWIEHDPIRGVVAGDWSHVTGLEDFRCDPWSSSSFLPRSPPRSVPHFTGSFSVQGLNQ